MRKLSLIPALLVFLAPGSAHAYIGPGAGAGTIAIILGILASIAMVFFAVIWYPAKRLVNKFRADRKDVKGAAADLPEGRGDS